LFLFSFALGLCFLLDWADPLIKVPGVYDQRLKIIGSFIVYNTTGDTKLRTGNVELFARTRASFFPVSQGNITLMNVITSPLLAGVRIPEAGI
jgi:hypothetical protein